MTLGNLNFNLDQARRLTLSGQILQAEALYGLVLKDWPGQPTALRALADIAMHREDAPRALGFLAEAVRRHPNDQELTLSYAAVLVKAHNLPEATDWLERAVARDAKFHAAWLFLGQLRDAKGDTYGALRAWYEAIIGAQRAGLWLGEDTTTPQMLQQVIRAVEKVRKGREILLYESYGELRQQLGAAAVGRVDKALAGYLRKWNATPPDSRQRPRFFYFPDLPDLPYHDPFLQPWAAQLQSSVDVIRNDAQRVFAEDQKFQPFLVSKGSNQTQEHISGSGTAPAWDAFFFYRHGERFDKNHDRCPDTSAVLESIELCRISDQAPEICFSVLGPGTQIMPHYGVSNVRLVMHLPLLIPGNCALNLIDAGEHHWEQGNLVMFDDTFQHEAWNRSDTPRIVLLMDCWNPHLTSVEKTAVKQLIEMITAFQLADRAAQVAEEGEG